MRKVRFVAVTLLSALAVSLLAIVPPVPRAVAAPVSLQQVDVASDGSPGDASSFSPAISADGRYVAFGSLATNLASGIPVGFVQVYVHDRQTGLTTLESTASNGTPGNDTSGGPSISADGRYVAFVSTATNLVLNDTNGGRDIFVRDRQTGTTERVSVDAAGNQLNGSSHGFVTISTDGRFVSFGVFAGVDTGSLHLFVRDRQLGTTVQADVSSAGVPGNQGAGFSRMSGNGRFVVFYSISDNLVANDTNAEVDIFVHDLQTGATERVSVSSAGTQSNDRSLSPSISADGRYVSFQSTATNLVASDSNGTRPDEFVRDRQTATTKLVDVDSDGHQFASGMIFADSISPDGRFVSFEGIQFPDINQGSLETFVYDQQTGQTIILTARGDGEPATGGNVVPQTSFAANTNEVAFNHASPDLVPGGNASVSHVFVRDLGVPTNPTIAIHTPPDLADLYNAIEPYSQGSTVVADYSCSEGWIDGGSVSCVGTVPDGSPIDTSTLGVHNFSVTATDATGQTTTATHHYKVVLSDGDGVSTSQEGLAPPPAGCSTCVVGDGNGDGTQDADQPNVASLPSAGSGNPYVTISSTATSGTTLTDVQALDPGLLPPPPNGAQQPVGVLSFAVQGVTVGGSADVTINLPPGSGASSYLKFQNNTWSDFTNNTTFNGDVVTLHLVDGGAGDADGTANGVIIDPGSPVIVPYTLSGFFAPVDNLPTVNTVKAGSSIPVKFGLGGNRGLDIFATGSPSTSPVACGAAPTDDIEQTVTAGNSSLSYDSGSKKYQYVWKTDKTWKGCRDLVLRFRDGSSMRARFSFK